MRVTRVLAGAAAGLAVAGCGIMPPQGGGAPSASASQASPTPTRTPVTLAVDTGKVSALKVRHVPDTVGNELARLPNGSSIIVDCVVKGTSVTGSQGTTDRWGHVSFQGKSGYVAAAYLVGGPTADLPTCPIVPAIATTPRPLPTPSAGDAAARAVAIARSQLGVAERGADCSPYSKTCEEWSAHFAAWVWQKAGIKIPDRSFTGDLYVWGVDNARAHDGTDGVAPGALVFFGTAPGTRRTSTRVDVVVEVFPDRLRVVGGNASDQVLLREVPRTGIYGYLAANR